MPTKADPKTNWSFKLGLLILVTVFVLGLVVGIPVAITLGLSSLSYLLVMDIPPVVMPQKMYAGMDVFVLLSIPGFILAGNLMNRGGITERIIRFANGLVGWIRGGLGLTNVGASMLLEVSPGRRLQMLPRSVAL